MAFVVCPKCGAENFDRSKKCLKCGSALKKRECAGVEESPPKANDHSTDEDGADCDIFIKCPPYKGLFASNWKPVTLDKFILKDGIITVSCQDGASISASIEDVKTTIAKEMGGTNTGKMKWYTCVIIQKNTGESIKFLDPSNLIEPEQWNKVMDILKPEYNSLGYVLSWLVCIALILAVLILIAVKRG